MAAEALTADKPFLVDCMWPTRRSRGIPREVKAAEFPIMRVSLSGIPQSPETPHKLTVAASITDQPPCFGQMSATRSLRGISLGIFEAWAFLREPTISFRMEMGLRVGPTRYSAIRY